MAEMTVFRPYAYYRDKPKGQQVGEVIPLSLNLAIEERDHIASKLPIEKWLEFIDPKWKPGVGNLT